MGESVKVCGGEGRPIFDVHYMADDNLKGLGCHHLNSPTNLFAVHTLPIRFYLAYKETPESRDLITDLTLIRRHYLR